MYRHRMRTALALGAAAGLLTAGCSATSSDAAKPAPNKPADAQGQAERSPDAQSQDSSTVEDKKAAKEAPSPATQQKSAARTPWCSTSALSVSLRQLSPAAGNRYTALVLTNTSKSSCRTQGYVGLQLVSADGSELPTTVVRERSRTPEQLTIKPGAGAWSRLHWSQVPGKGDSSAGSCQPAPAELEVIPPDQRTHTDGRWSYGEVCSSGRIEARPLASGTGPAA